MLLRNAVVILLGSNNVKETSVWICTKELHRKRVMREARLNAELGTWTEDIVRTQASYQSQDWTVQKLAELWMPQGSLASWAIDS